MTSILEAMRSVEIVSLQCEGPGQMMRLSPQIADLDPWRRSFRLEDLHVSRSMDSLRHEDRDCQGNVITH